MRPLMWACLAVTAIVGAGGCSRRVPWGWTVSQDASGACEVATPSGWQMGREFFLKHEKAESVKDRSGRLPPRGLALWGIERGDHRQFPQVAPGKQFQIRASVVRGDGVCSVWRVKEAVSFTDAEKSTMKRVGKTLRCLP